MNCCKSDPWIRLNFGKNSKVKVQGENGLDVSIASFNFCDSLLKSRKILRIPDCSSKDIDSVVVRYVLESLEINTFEGTN